MNVLKPEEDPLLGKYASHFCVLAAIAVFALGVIQVYRSLFWGVNTIDESGYVAIPFSFVSGNRPFFDELALAQTVGILLTPFVELFLWITKSKDGIVLFVRHLYFLMLLGMGAVGYRFARRWVSVPVALFLLRC